MDNCPDCKVLKNLLKLRSDEIDRLIGEVDDYKGIVWKLEQKISNLKKRRQDAA